MLQEYVKAFLLIFLAEMGDKTQLLALLFSTKYKVKKVLIGVFIGSFLNHGLAIAFGTYLSSIIPLKSLQIIAGIMFVIFGLCAFYNDKDEECAVLYKFSPIVTVATAFFIGELGDKTQLAAVTLSVDAKYPLIILMGTVSGMIFTSLIGMIVGSKLGKKTPVNVIKYASACIFLCFGVVKLSRSLPGKYVNICNGVILFAIIMLIAYLLIQLSIKARQINHAIKHKR